MTNNRHRIENGDAPAKRSPPFDVNTQKDSDMTTENMGELALESNAVPFPQIVPAVIDHRQVNAVDARELHASLGVGRDFANWIKDRIEKYGFSEGSDFSPELAKSRGGRPSIEYTLSLDMAKELAMVENNERGRQVRRYFIEVEKSAAVHHLHIPATYADALRQLADETEKTQALEAQAREDAPKIEAYERAINADGSVGLTEAAKMLGQRPHQFTRWLNGGGYIYKRPGGKAWIAYQPKIQSGLLDHKTHIQRLDDGTERVRDQVLVTGKGLMHFAKKLGVQLPAEGGEA